MKPKCGSGLKREGTLLLRGISKLTTRSTLGCRVLGVWGLLLGVWGCCWAFGWVLIGFWGFVMRRVKLLGV